jgi:hypothetical protein
MSSTKAPAGVATAHSEQSITKQLFTFPLPSTSLESIIIKMEFGIAIK